jgi:hypothetical protein
MYPPTVDEGKCGSGNTLSEIHQTYEEELLDKLDEIILVLREKEVIAEEINGLLKANQNILKGIVGELHKITINTN